MGKRMRIFFELTRLEFSTFVFLAVFLPLAVQHGNMSVALRYAWPMLPICMCGFVLNNLHDLERDRKNHPGRPLPMEKITQTASAVLFFVLLAIALVSIRMWIPAQHAYPYLLLLILMNIYNYVVTYFAYLKNVIVGFAGLIPILVVASVGSPAFPFWPILCAALFFILCVEILSDILDASGDGFTFVKVIGLRAASYLAFAFKLISDLVLLFSSTTVLKSGLSLTILAIDSVLFLVWQASRRRKSVIGVMKAELLVALIFLI